MGQYVDYYYSNNRLKNLVDKILVFNYGWIPLKDYDDFYSIAGMCLWYCEEHYDESKNKSFRRYLVDSLHRKFKTQLTKMNRKKRGGGVAEISLDKFINEEDDTTLGETLATEEIPDIDPLAQRYLDSLTQKQRQVAELMMDGYDGKFIKKILGLTDERFEMICQRMRSDEKTEPLKKLRRKII